MSQGTFQEQLRALITEYSEKAASAYSQAAPEVLPFLSAEAARRWVEMGCSLAHASASAGVKYFRESPETINAILRACGDKASVQSALEIGLTLAARDYGIALEYFRHCPRVLTKIGVEGLQGWAQIATDLASQSDSVGYGTAIEYLKESPRILDHLSLAHLSLWAQLGLVLAIEDQKNKDFLALEFFRVSPELLGQITFGELRPLLLEIALPLAKTSSKLAMEFLKRCPAILVLLNSLESQNVVLDLCKTLVQVSPTVVPVFMSHSVEALTLTEGSLTQFQQWARKGIEIAQTNPERAGAYFSLKLKISHDALSQLSCGIFLKDISRMLRYYAEGLCGIPVEIRPGVGHTGQPTTSDGVITLPEKVTVFPQPEDNFRFYKVMTFHEAGHLEFGSYDPVSPYVLSDIQDDPEVCLKQALNVFLSDIHPADRVHVQKLLDHFPDTVLANNLWMIVEEGRIDYLLRQEYMGIRGDMDFVISQQLRGRPTLSVLSPRQAILEALLQLSVADSSEVPLGVADVVSRAYTILKMVQHPTSTVDDSLKATCSLYVLIKKYLLGLREETASNKERSRANPPEAGSLDEAVGMGHGALDNLAYRNPLDLQDASTPFTPKTFSDQPPPMLKETVVPQQSEEHMSRKETTQATPLPIHPKQSQENIYYYDEWDMASGDYRPHWCRLEEKMLRAESSEKVDRIRNEYGAMTSLLRRYFEYLRPQAFKKIKKQEYGEEIDIETVIDSLVERKAGLSPLNRVYSLRQKKTRDVSAAFLIDMSGSTNQQIGSADQGWQNNKRVIDVEREGLLLLGEALEAIGDEFAMFGFSGHSRNHVNFYKIKDFDEAYGELVQRKIGAIKSEGQNRDGTAIRHTTTKLLGRSAKIKLLILLSDGKPLDEDYKGVHAIEDTRMALREARAKGIHPFCITVDRDAREYIHEMYDQVSYTIINNIATLPQKLPRIYKQLTT